MRIRALVCALVLAAGLAATADAGAAVRVLATGDSMVEPLLPRLERELGRAVSLREDPRAGSGISKRQPLDWVAHARRQMRTVRPRATVMFVGANDGHALVGSDGRTVDCCRRSWVDAYAARVRSMLARYTSGGARVYWLTLPAPRHTARAQVFAAVNAAVRQAVVGQPRAELVEIADYFTPGWRYRNSMLVHGRRVVVRERDGVHLSPSGAYLAARLVSRALRADGAAP